MIHKSTLQFLEALEENNNREWFAENKSLYDEALLNAKSLFADVNENLGLHDEIEKQKIYRIYRDVRFSKNKTPYKPRFATGFMRLGKHLRGSYLLQLKPGESMVAGGFWQPEKDDLFRIRKEFELDDSEIREVLNEAKFKEYFNGTLHGDELKTAPKGFDKTHSAIDLIRKKGFVAIRRFSDDEVLSENFAKEVDNTFKALRSYFNLMSDILTTDLNGESLL